MQRLREWFRKVFVSTTPRDAESHFGTQETVDAFKAVHNEDAVKLDVTGKRLY